MGTTAVVSRLPRRLLVAGLLLVVSVAATTVTAMRAVASSRSVGLRAEAQPARDPGHPLGRLHPAGAASGHPTSANPLRVALYGDSLAFQAQDYFVGAIRGAGPATVLTHTFGGTAICDFLPQMSLDAQAFRPQAVVVEFSGNAFTPCMQDVDGQPLSGSALLYRYATDAHRLLDVFAATGARVYFVSYPISRAAALAGSPAWNQLNELYRGLRRDPSADFVDAAQAVELDGRYTDTLPCRAGEPCTGGIDGHGHAVDVVRAPDGVHFCPGAARAVDGVTGACPVWSSGASRYATAMAAPVIRDFFREGS